MEIAPGTWTVITGASGSGKSTLLSLIAGMRRASAGTVRGRPPTSAGADTRRMRLGRTADGAARRDRPRQHPPRPSEATEQQIQQAVDAAGLGAVSRSPRRADTRLGEGGWGVSTGEARRIAIARAFLRGARLWLLDEPTAHLDADSERKSSRPCGGPPTVARSIIATHSFALAAAADTVLAIGDGLLHDARPVNAR